MNAYRPGLQKEPEVKGALRADDADILSAYSTEQGLIQPFCQTSSTFKS